MTSDNPNAFALLIGVGDYRTFDPTGQSDLAGPINDVIGWWHIARDLGIPPQNIRICVAPGLPPDVLGRGIQHAMVTGANHGELVDGLTWLAKMLDGTDGTKAALTWSGHGTRTGDGQVMCPADVYADGQTLENGLLVSRVRALLDQRHPETRITAFVDTCHTETGFGTPAPARARALHWPGAAATPKLAAGATPHRAFGDLVVTSSEVGAVSYEMPVIGGMRGAFSWAASNLIHRYGLDQAAGGATSGLSFDELAQRCGQILAGMAVEQTPRYVGDPQAASLRVFSTFGDGQLGSAAPQALPGQEIWPGTDGEVMMSKLYDLDDVQIGTLYFTANSPPSGWSANRQYWQWSSGAWPTQTFKGDTPVATSVSQPTNVSVYETSTLSPKTEVVTFSSGSPTFSVSASLSGATIGYFRPHADHLTVYSTQSSAPSFLSSSYQPLWFSYSNKAMTVTTYAVARDDEI